MKQSMILAAGTTSVSPTFFSGKKNTT